ncbi:MAG: ABC transporter permease [Chloroflexota bacterium]
MRTLLTIALHEFLVTFRRRSFQVVTVLLPLCGLAALLILQAVTSRETTPKVTRVGYVDGVGIFANYRVQNGAEFTPYSTLDVGMQALLREEIRRLYVIPSDYLTIGSVQRYAVGEGLNLAGGRDPDPALRGFLLDNLLGAHLETEVASRIKDPLHLATHTVDAQGNLKPIDVGRFIFFQALAILLVVAIFMSSGFLLQGVGEEKDGRIMEVLLSSVTPGQLLLGKILGLGVAGLGQILIWLVSGVALLKLAGTLIPDWPISAPGAVTLLGVLFFALGFLFYATLMAALGAISSTARESQQLSGIFVVPAIVPFYLMPYVAAHPTGAIVRFLTLFPLTSPIMVFQRLGASSIEPWEVLASAGVLGLAVVGAILLAVRVFRAYLLMYGKRPGLWDLLRTLVRA